MELDRELLKKVQAIFSEFTPQKLTRNPCIVEAEQVVRMIKEKQSFVILDIRTPLEQEFIAPRLKDTLYIPMHELFKEENLEKLPKDKTIIVLCHTDRRATAVVIALRLLGFGYTFVLKDGVKGLAERIGKDIYRELLQSSH